MITMSLSSHPEKPTSQGLVLGEIDMLFGIKMHTVQNEVRLSIESEVAKRILGTGIIEAEVIGVTLDKKEVVLTYSVKGNARRKLIPLNELPLNIVTPEKSVWPKIAGAAATVVAVAGATVMLIRGCATEEKKNGDDTKKQTTVEEMKRRPAEEKNSMEKLY